MMENTGFDNRPDRKPERGPFRQRPRQPTTGLASNYFGVNPSPVSQITLPPTSGSTNGIANDNDNHLSTSLTSWISLEANRKNLEGPTCSPNSLFAITPAGSTLCGNQLYERKHNPFISYQDVQSNPARMANIVDFGPVCGPTWRAAKVARTTPGFSPGPMS